MPNAAGMQLVQVGKRTASPAGGEANKRIRVLPYITQQSGPSKVAPEAGKKVAKACSAQKGKAKQGELRLAGLFVMQMKA